MRDPRKVKGGTGDMRQSRDRVVAYCFLLPSVAQPPLPLQEFLPLQPLSPVLQPPLPLQEFLPAQSCFSVVSSSLMIFEPGSCLTVGLAVAASARPAVPASRPVNAAAAAIVYFVLFF